MVRVVWLACLVTAAPLEGEVMTWARLPDLPDQEGFAGVFSGVVEDGEQSWLVVAGGANFPGKRPWEGGQKNYYDNVFVLSEEKGARWRAAQFTLPSLVAYGMSVTVPERGSCLFIGGKHSDTTTGREVALSSVYELRREEDQFVLKTMPSLPVPVAEGVAEVVGDLVVVIGGATNQSGESGLEMVTLRRVFALDLQAVEAGWEERSWPINARGRMYAVGGVSQGQVYLFGGRDHATSQEAVTDRIFGLDFLRDCHAYDPVRDEWRRLTDLPYGLSAGPSSAVEAGVTHLLMLGGVRVDFLRAQVEARPEVDGQGMDHPGFPGVILAYDTLTDTWAEAGSLPVELESEDRSLTSAPTWASVTTPVVRWNGSVIVPTGEIKPGVRSPQVLSGTVVAEQADFGALNWMVVVAYLLGMVGVGYWFMRRKSASSTEAYFRGGQRIPWWVAGLSIFATMLSALTFMGIPARAYQTDVTWYLGQLTILLVIPLVVFCYLPFFRRLDLTSAYLYLEMRFNLAARLVASLSFMVFHVGRIAIVLYLPALALAAVSDIPVVVAILVIGVLCVLYTVMGGIEAVVWTDAIQALVLLGGAVLCLILVLLRVDGGVAEVVDIAVQDRKLFQNLRWDSLDVADGTSAALVLFVAFFFNALVPYTSGQDVVQRYVTTKDLKSARKSLWTTMWMSVFGSMVFFGLGVAIYAFYKSHPGALDPALPSTDSILPFFIMQQLPTGVSGLVIAAIFAASQSTVSSSLNSVATAWSKDFDARLFRPGREDADYLAAAKWVVCLVGGLGVGVAVVMARSDMESAFKTFQSIIGLTAGPLGGLFALGVFTKGANGSGAMAGAIAGFATVLGLRGFDAPVTGLLYACIGFGVCAVVGYAASLVFGGGTERGSGLSLRG